MYRGMLGWKWSGYFPLYTHCQLKLSSWTALLHYIGVFVLCPFFKT